MKYFLHATCMLFLIAWTQIALAYKVSSLAATYKDGQVFLTWTNPAATNLKYRVYRSTTQITTSSQLSSAQYMGYTRDNPGKNIRKSSLKGTNVFYTIEATSGPLSDSKGLYVMTCTDNQTWYYAVTVENLSTGSEVRNITPGQNSLTTGVQESVAPIKPILQSTVNDASGDVVYEYVVFGDNHGNSFAPALNNCGFYGYNFSYIHHTDGYVPLYILYRDTDPFTRVAAPDECGECNTLLMDDWLPNGENTYWFGYHENYDMYSSTNSVNNSGTIRSYTQARVKWTIQWVENNYGLDATRVYSSGFSHNGFGAMLTGIMYPQLIAATWANVAPIIIKALKGSTREKMWCAPSVNLPTDVLDPNTGTPINVWTLFDFRQGLVTNNYVGVPYFGGVHGKKDVTVGWVQSLGWYDSVEDSRQGGVWFWDQRNHNGGGKNFTSDEAMIQYSRFSTAKSYPAFSYCSINQDPGGSSPTSGDPYGAINGYLDWDDNSIVDLNCSYTIKCNVKDMYVNGVLQTAYDSCTTDITLRRLQNFHPVIGATINWSVMNNSNQIIQNGSYLYDGEPPTIYGAKIYRAGSTINFQVQNCFGKQNASTGIQDPVNVRYFKTSDGYRVSVELPASAMAQVRLMDLSGRTAEDKTIRMADGMNEFELTASPGIYLLQMQIGGKNIIRKLAF